MIVGVKMKKVLIIEDEEPIAKAEGLILENHFKIHYAKNGKEGYELAKRLKPDLLILDLMLPERGGYDLCFHFRQDDELKDMKILMVTALSQGIDKDKGKLVGANAYLTKPFEPSQLKKLALELTK
ncbi:MAG: response regulator [Nanoarchaeota archaeon]|nr:response regulator [Nanoarchaeota archaeon]